MENEVQQNITPVQPLIQTPIPTQPPTNWSKNLLFTVLGLIIVAGSVFVGIQIGKSQTPSQQPVVAQPTASPTQIAVNQTIQPTANLTTNPITDWKTYTNSKYNFSFKYPSDWITKFVSVSGFDDQVWIADSVSSMPTTLPGQIGNGARASITIQISSKDISLNYSEKDFNQFESLSYNVGGLTGIRKTGISKEGLSRETIITVKMGNEYLNIMPLDTETNKQHLDQILSTFKFTN